MQVDDAALDALLDNGGFEPELGARPMRRAVSRWVEAPIADLILDDKVSCGATVMVDVGEDGQLTFAVQAAQETVAQQSA